MQFKEDMRRKIILWVLILFLIPTPGDGGLRASGRETFQF